MMIYHHIFLPLLASIYINRIIVLKHLLLNKSYPFLSSLERLQFFILISLIAALPYDLESFDGQLLVVVHGNPIDLNVMLKNIVHPYLTYIKLYNF